MFTGNQNFAEPLYNDLAYMEHRIAMTFSEFAKFSRTLNFSFFMSLSEISGFKPYSYIRSMYYYPFDITPYFHGSISYFSLKDVVISVDSTKARQEVRYDNPTVNGGSITIDPPFTGDKYYLNYKCKYELYVPFYGYVKLDPREILGQTIYADYIVNFGDGSAVVTVFRGSRGSREAPVVLATDTIQLGVDVTLATNTGELTKAAKGFANLLSKSFDAANSLSGNVSYSAITKTSSAQEVKRVTKKKNKETGRFNIASKTTTDIPEASTTTESVHSTAPSLPDLAMNFNHNGIQRGGTTNGVAGFYMPQKLAIIVTKPKVIEPESYARIFGKPCNKTVSAVSAIAGSGLTTFSGFHLEGAGFGEATDAELAAIKQSLEAGVIL